MWYIGVDAIVRTQAAAQYIAAVMKGNLFKFTRRFLFAQRVGECRMKRFGIHIDTIIAFQWLAMMVLCLMNPQSRSIMALGATCSGSRLKRAMLALDSFSDSD